MLESMQEKRGEQSSSNVYHYMFQRPSGIRADAGGQAQSLGGSRGGELMESIIPSKGAAVGDAPRSDDSFGGVSKWQWGRGAGGTSGLHPQSPAEVTSLQSHCSRDQAGPTAGFPWAGVSTPPSSTFPLPPLFCC